MNKWIFWTVLGIVASLPLMIPGCSPLSDNSFSIDGQLAAAIVEPSIGLANNQAIAEGRKATLTDVQELIDSATADGTTGAGMFETKIVGNKLEVRSPGSPIVACTVTIVDGAADANC